MSTNVRIFWGYNPEEDKWVGELFHGTFRKRLWDVSARWPFDEALAEKLWLIWLEKNWKSVCLHFPTAMDFWSRYGQEAGILLTDVVLYRYGEKLRRRHPRAVQLSFPWRT